MALVSKAFGDIITFTRASSATRINSSGLIETVTTDTPRFDYDPVTLAAKGLLIEEARTNLHLYSQDFSTGWIATATVSTLTPTAATAPDGTTTAGSFLCADTTDVNRRLYPDANIAATELLAYTYTVYVKPVGGWQWLGVSVSPGTSVTNASSAVNFDLINGVKGSLDTGTNSITGVGNGWWRITASGTLPAGQTTIRPKLILVDDSGNNAASVAVGVVGAGVYVWGAQLEQAEFPTSYIPTTTSQTTRAADIPVMTGTNFSSWYNQTEGTFVAQVSPTAFVSNGFFLSAGTATTRVLNAYTNATSINAFSVAGTAHSSLPFKVAGSYLDAGATFTTARSVNGGAVGVGAPSTGTIDRLWIGRSYTASPGSFGMLNGHIQRITYYPRRLTDAELQAITT